MFDKSMGQSLTESQSQRQTRNVRAYGSLKGIPHVTHDWYPEWALERINIAAYLNEANAKMFKELYLEIPVTPLNNPEMLNNFIDRA